MEPLVQHFRVRKSLRLVCALHKSSESICMNVVRPANTWLSGPASFHLTVKSLPATQAPKSHSNQRKQTRLKSFKNGVGVALGARQVPVCCRRVQHVASCQKPNASLEPTHTTQRSGKSLPVALFCVVVACQFFGTRHSTQTAEGILLLLDVAYAGLHLHPLLPLFQRHGRPDMAFMQSYTRPVYFVSECWLLAWLMQTSSIRAEVPVAVLAGHGVVHVLFVVLAGVAADWAMQQQVQRIQNGWKMTDLAGMWHTLVNMVNFADLSLHCWYIAILWQSIAQSANGPSTVFWCLPIGIVVAGLVASYSVAAVFPRWLNSQDP